jgi:fluoride exporter
MVGIMFLKIPLLISSGAILGALSRHYLTLAFPAPINIFFVNITGCFLIGILANLLGQKPELRLLFITGFLGSYTTFSTYALDIMHLWQKGKLWQALLYGFASPSLGALMAYFGLQIKLFK